MHVPNNKWETSNSCPPNNKWEAGNTCQTTNGKLAIHVPLTINGKWAIYVTLEMNVMQCMVSQPIQARPAIYVPLSILWKLAMHNPYQNMGSKLHNGPLQMIETTSGVVYWYMDLTSRFGQKIKETFLSPGWTPYTGSKQYRGPKWYFTICRNMICKWIKN